MTTSLHRILFGSLVFADGTTASPMDTDYQFYVWGGNFSTGKPEPILRTIESFMLDGASVIKDGDGNRQMTMYVGIKGSDTRVLTDGEVALTLETGKRNSLIIETHDDFGPPTLFEVVMSSFGQVPDDLLERMKCQRVFALEVTALPQAFSTTVTVTPALTTAAVPSTLTINDCSSATGWLLYPSGGAPSVVSGALEFNGVLTSNVYQTGVTWDVTSPSVELTTTAVDMSDTIYVSVDVTTTTTPTGAAVPLAVSEICGMYADGQLLTLVSTAPAPTGTGKRYTFLCADTSVTKFRPTPGLSAVYTDRDATAPTVLFRVDNLIRTNVAPTAGSTAKQSSRLLPIGGSGRTPGALLIQHETSALGNGVLVHTCPNFGIGYAPNLMRYYATGGTQTNDAASCSGFKVAGPSVSFDPLTRSLPSGSYALLARVKHPSASGAVTATWSTTARSGGVNYGSTQTGTRTFTPTTTYAPVTLGTLELPSSAELVKDTSSSYQRVTVSFGATSLDVDEVWLFFLGDHLGNRGHLTQVDCGTAAPSVGGSSNRLWIQSATVDHPLPGVYAGTAATDAHYVAGALSEQHEFVPPGIQVHVVTPNADAAKVSFEHREAGHSHAPS